MGIRGLTTFVANQANKYLETYQLHDCYLVVDGNNIAAQLYKWHCERNDCFGGDYDKYARLICKFFNLLLECNITPLIVFDGGYEDKKIRTIYGRLKEKISAAKRLNSVTQGSITTFPLFLRELFIGVVLRLGLKMVRCDLEADYEMACLARSLNCPVLSYDSDFYIFDVLYIPFLTLELNKYRIKNSSPARYYVHCKLYRIEKFLKLNGDLNKSNLPLIAVLLGNDYINKGIFRNFYSQIKLCKSRNINSGPQREIVSVIRWLQNETYESAVRKILGRLKMKERKQVAEQIKLITEGYICRNSTLMAYLDIKTENVKTTFNFTFDTENVLKNINRESQNNDNESYCSDLSESSDDPDLNVILHESVQETSHIESISEWFKDKFRKCEYPSSFMNILLRTPYICTAQLEDYDNICSHHISASILSAINKILLSGTSENLKYVARSENAGIKTYATPPCSLELPTLSEVQNIKPDVAKNLLFNILAVSADGGVIEFIESLPGSWQLYVLSVVYWIKNAKPPVAYCNVYSVVLCMLVVNKVVEDVGYYRSSRKFLQKYGTKINNLLKSQAENKSSGTYANITQLISNISSDDSLMCFNEVIHYFKMDEKMSSHVKLFDIRIVDCFAQFQSCLLHISQLNMLLNKPVVDILISDFYDGTFLYNMTGNLMKRNDVDAYMNVLLKSSPSILNCFKTIVSMLVNIMSEDITCAAPGKRRRKKKKHDVSRAPVIENECNEIHESEDEGIVDVNNRFALLHLTR